MGLGNLFAVRGGLFDEYILSDLLPDPDPILRGKGEDVKVLSSLLADEQVTSTILARKYRVLNKRDFGFIAGQKRGLEADQGALRVYEKLMEDMESWEMFNIISQVLDTPFFGFVPFELSWEMKEGWWRLRDISSRPHYWFGYNKANKLIFLGNKGEEEEIPFGKIVVSRHFPTYENPYGLRLLSRVLWPVSFKRGGIGFYAKFMEKYGNPWAIGQAPLKATREEKSAMARDLAKMVQDCVAVIPSGAQVQLLTPSGGNGEMHERFLSRWDSCISKVLMGQTLTMELDSGVGSRAASATHLEVANDIAKADFALVEDFMNEIGWIYTQINGDKNILAPTFKYHVAEDYRAKAELDLQLSQLGVRFTKEYFEREYKLNKNEFKIDELKSDECRGEELQTREQKNGSME